MHKLRALCLISVLFAAFICAGILSSCSEETEIERLGAARLTPSVAVDPSIVNCDGKMFNLSELVPQPDDLGFSLIADDGRYAHTWSSIADYPVTEPLRPGAYTAVAFYGSEYNEGFDTPNFYGFQHINLASGDAKDITITASLASAMVKLNVGDNLKSGFSDCGILLHSEGFSYLRYSAKELRPAFIHPGNVNIAVSVITASGEAATIEIAENYPMKARHLYEIELSGDNGDEPTITVTVNGTEAGSVRITRALLQAPALTVTPYGLNGNGELNISEGDSPDQALGFNISQADATSLVLTTIDGSLTDDRWPAQIDLADADDTQLSALESKGLRLTRNSSGAITAVDLTDVVKHLRYRQGQSSSQFILMARSATGKMSEPASVHINLEPVEIAVKSVSDIIIGVNAAEIIVISHNGDIENNIVVEANTGTVSGQASWNECPITNIEKRGESEYAVRFSAPEGTIAQLPVRVIYCGNVMAETTVKRVAPDFSFEVDAYALSAVIKINAAGNEIRDLICSLIKIYVDGKQTTVGKREGDEGYCMVGSLQPSHTYTIKATLLDNPSADDFTKEVTFSTESTLSIKNSDFEDHGDGVRFKNLPSGGRYSQSIVDIFNQQNFTTYQLDVPRNWANTNAKTFCTEARNLNTWYLNPSVFSDIDNVANFVSVVLQSVAWDLDGEKIPDYRQQQNQFIAYNPNVPFIRRRAAGKVFLGSYEFNPATGQETYMEGINFGSRPVAVNGNYHFSPCSADLSDAGLVKVEVLGIVNGQETVIASSSKELPAALTFTAFTVPLTYNYFGVKATKLKIMLSSSRHIGSIEYESQHIQTSPDPVTATSLGGKLWIEDLSLSYY